MRAQGFPPLRALPIRVSALRNASLILKPSTAFTICTPAAFTPLRPRRKCGLTGRGTFGATAIPLLQLVKDKDYFVITTNVDHQFQKAGFDKSRLFYTQGDYGLFQCSEPCHSQTYDNEATVKDMIEFQEDMKIPSELIPKCPRCGKPMTMNLRCDDKFVEDEGWHRASERYDDFLQAHEGQHILFLELGVGFNTPVIIKYPFWRMTAGNPNAVYACLNYSEAYAPGEIGERSICIGGDIREVLMKIR